MRMGGGVRTAVLFRFLCFSAVYGEADTSSFSLYRQKTVQRSRLARIRLRIFCSKQVKYL